MAHLQKLECLRMKAVPKIGQVVYSIETTVISTSSLVLALY